MPAVQSVISSPLFLVGWAVLMVPSLSRDPRHPPEQQPPHAPDEVRLGADRALGNVWTAAITFTLAYVAGYALTPGR
jgi:hypothetical protein